MPFSWSDLPWTRRRHHQCYHKDNRSDSDDIAVDCTMLGLHANPKTPRAAAPSFSGFSAQRGEKLFRTTWAGGDARTPSCTSCHTENTRGPGRNAKTGREIEPVAVSANPKRFTDRSDVDRILSHGDDRPDR